MRIAETMDLLNDLEERLPVAEWTADGVRIWPLVRLALPRYVLDLYVAMVENAHHPSRARQIERAVTDLVRPPLAALRDRSHRARRKQHDVVFLGDGVSKVWLETEWHDRLCDPLREALSARGLTSLQLDPGRRPLVPRRHPSVFIQPTIDMARIRSRGATPEAELLHLPGHAELLDTVARYTPGAEHMTEPVIARQASQLRRLARWYQTQLERQGARLAFVVDYGVSSMAFNLACSRLGILSVEIQHGGQGPLNPVYSRWADVPDGGYELLPSAYWVWSAVEAEIIESWSAATAPKHRAVAGGNVWLEYWRDGTSELVRRYDEQLRAARVRAPGQHHILVPLATGHTTDAHLQPFVDAIAARPTWRWWIRAHPTMPAAEAAHAKQVLSSVPGAQVELTASELPLYGILRNIDAVATVSSGVVVEAALMGVPSVMTDVEIQENHAHEIETGWVYVTPTDVVGGLEHQLQRVRDLAPYAPAQSTLDEALESLLPADLQRSG